MNEQLASELSYLERTIQYINDASNAAIKKYNSIMVSNFSPLKGVIEAAGGNFLLNASKITVTYAPLAASSAAATGSTLAISGPTLGSTLALPGPTTTALATTGTTALSTTTAAGTAAGTTAAAGGAVAGGSALAVIGPIVAAAAGGLLLGKGIGDFGCAIADIVKGKAQLDELEKNVKVLKSYCNTMNDELFETVYQIRNVKTKVTQAREKLKKQEYPKKEANVKRIIKREKELEAIDKDICQLMNSIHVVFLNLSKIY